MAQKTAKNPKGAGRTIIQIDWAQFDKLCALQCTLSEIASFFGCSEDTIETRVKEEYGINFSELYSKRRQFGKISIRRKQFQVAESGNPTMLIWLGKQWLEQKEKTEVRNENVDLNKMSDQELVDALKGFIKSEEK